MRTTYILATLPLLSMVYAQSTASCSTLTNDRPAPSMAPGYQAQIAANGLKFPRSLQFDSSGHLLVVDRGVGILRFSIDDCLLLQERTLVVNDTELNHGIALSADGNTLFASTPDVAYAWAYNSETGEVTDRKELVTGMGHGGHVTRTLLSSVAQPDLLVISSGSDGNFDEGTTQLSSGRSQIRGFNITEVSERSVNYGDAGIVFGWGLRNSVGLGEDGDGQLWSVENSADNVNRSGVDVHDDNPGEEMNFHGKLTDFSERGNYGYPNCFAVWNASLIPDNNGLITGDQFSLDESNTLNDTTCSEDYQPPRLAFGAHQAPLDIKFDGDGQAWITFHGSWNREMPIGYKLVTVSFRNYQPTEPNSSTSAARDVMANADVTKCPNGCFRPVGLAFDDDGRLFVSSDSTGEIYVVRKDDGSGAAPPPTTAGGSSSMTTSPTPTIFTVTSDGQVSTVTSTGAPAATTTPGAGSRMEMNLWSLAVIVAFQALLWVL